jgi:type IV pilus assembly protein PilM
MVSWWNSRRCGPIGVDIGSRSVKLLQLDGPRSDVWEAARADLPPHAADDPQAVQAAVVQALTAARRERRFRGSEAVFCLRGAELFAQNIRVPQGAAGEELAKIVHFEAAGRLPYPGQEAEIRFLEAADVRQGDTVRREVIVLACHRQAIARLLAVAEAAHLFPVAIDTEPTALVRSYVRQGRRDEDQQNRVLFVHLGAASTMVVIARGPDVMFVKFLPLGGQHLDEAVARHLDMDLAHAAAMRRTAGERRSDQRDPEVYRSLGEALRPVLEQLATELSLCLRYYSVTFRGQPLAHVVVGGGEAGSLISEWLSARLELPCELGNPLRTFKKLPPAGRLAQWDVAAGLALREVN